MLDKMKLLEMITDNWQMYFSFKNRDSLSVSVDCLIRVCTSQSREHKVLPTHSLYLEAYFGLLVGLWAYNTADTWGQKPAEGNIQEGDVLPEKANGHQGEQSAVWEKRQSC